MKEAQVLKIIDHLALINQREEDPDRHDGIADIMNKLNIKVNRIVYNVPHLFQRYIILSRIFQDNVPTLKDKSQSYKVDISPREIYLEMLKEE